METARPAGEYNQRITIEVNTPTKDTNGQPLESWSTWSTLPNGCWAKIAATPQGGDVLKDKRISADSNYLVYVRSTPETQQITGLHRINWGGVILNIVGDPNDMDARKFELSINCRSRA